MEGPSPTSRRCSTAKCERSCPTSESESRIPGTSSRIRPIFTIGHSNRSTDEFAHILQAAGVILVVDVRTVPRSRANPQFNADALSDALARQGMRYGRIAGLGGLRGRSRTVPPDVNGYWENPSFHNYADYALSPTFGASLDELIDETAGGPTAIMCAEAVWWRCHRRIIADYLLLRGIPVLHLMGRDRVEPATMTPAARERDGRLVYPARGTTVSG